MATVWVTRGCLEVFSDRAKCWGCLGLCNGRVALLGLDSEPFQLLLRRWALVVPMLLMLIVVAAPPLPAMTNDEGQADWGGGGLGAGVQSTCVNTIGLHANAVRYETGCLQFRAIGRKTGRRYQSIRAFASRHGTLR